MAPRRTRIAVVLETDEEERQRPKTLLGDELWEWETSTKNNSLVREQRRRGIGTGEGGNGSSAHGGGFGRMNGGTHWLAGGVCGGD